MYTARNNTFFFYKGMWRNQRLQTGAAVSNFKDSLSLSQFTNKEGKGREIMKGMKNASFNSKLSTSTLSES